MKKILKKTLPIAILLSVFSGCVSSPVNGALYTSTIHSGLGDGGIVNDSVKSEKTGTATCTSVLGMFAFGDCSVDAAKKDGKITKVSSVSHESKNIAFFQITYKTIVKGE